MTDYPEMSIKGQKALASLRLSGFAPPSEAALAQMLLLEAGKISPDEFLNRSLKRILGSDSSEST